MAGYLIMGIVFVGVGALISLRLPAELHKGNYAALLALCFPLAGILFFIGFINGCRSQLRFGRCYFEPAQIPVPLGGTLNGTIRTGKPLRLEHELCLTLSCIQKDGRGKQTSESVLWQDEQFYSARANFTEMEPGHSAVPVRFNLPADQPECYQRGGQSVCWRLDVRSKTHGSGFHAAFDLPVFQTGATAATDTPGADPTIRLRASAEEIRQEQDPRIQVTTSPLGREFYFPPARNPGFALGMTIAALFFDLVPVLLVLHFGGNGFIAWIPLVIFGLIFGLFGLLFTCVSFGAWFKSSRITIDSQGVQAVNHWLFIIRRSRHFAAGDIGRFDIESRSSSGTRKFWDIQLHLRSQPRSGQPAPFTNNSITLANDVGGREEAEWLAAEMTRACGIRG
jgi:hypothetical protein